MAVLRLPPPPVHRPVVVLDADSGWRGLVAGGHAVHAVDPATVSLPRLTALRAVRVCVNLAAPSALPALVRLRAEGFEPPVFGLVAGPGSEHAVGLGRVEPVLEPFDAALLRQRLLGHAPLDARVLCAGPDAAALLAFRAAMAADGAPVSLAWNAPQAHELLGLMRPEVVLVDLALPPDGGHALVLRLAESAAAPLLLLRPGTRDDAAAFRRLVAGRVHRDFLRPRGDVLAATLHAPVAVRRGARRPLRAGHDDVARTG